jgi:hypothetical protein
MQLFSGHQEAHLPTLMSFVSPRLTEMLLIFTSSSRVVTRRHATKIAKIQDGEIIFSDI